MRATLLLLACVATATGCDGVLGINPHVLAEAGPRGDASEESDGESGVSVNPSSDAGAHADADASTASDQ